MRQRGVVGAQRVLDRVLARAAGQRFDKAGQRVGERHVRARLLVAALVHGGGERSADQLDRLQREHLADGRGGLGDIALGRVEKGVKALIGGQMGRDGHHKVRVHDRDGREALFAAPADLFLAVGDDGEGVGLGARARGGRDGDDRQAVLRDALAAARAAVDIIPPVALVGRHDGDRLGGVDRRAAAQAHDKRDVLRAAQRRAFAHALDGRVGLYLIIDQHFVAGFGQRVLDPGDIAQPRGGRAAGDDQAAALGQARPRELLHRAAAEIQARGHIEAENRHKCSSFFKKGALQQAPRINLFLFLFPSGVITHPTITL